MNIIGISAFHGASGAALLQNGSFKAAFTEERLTRVPWDRRLPINAFRSCLEYGQIPSPSQVDAIAVYRNPIKKLQRQLRCETDETLDQTMEWMDPHRAEVEIRRFLGFEGPVHYFDYLDCFVAGLDESVATSDTAVLSLCAIGDDAAMGWGRAGTQGIEWLGQRLFPHSPDFFLSAVTQFLGFNPLREEEQVFALARMGHPRLVKELEGMHRQLQGPSYELDLRYFARSNSHKLFTPSFGARLDCRPRAALEAIEAIHFDIAASAIAIYEKVLIDLISTLHKRVPSPRLRLSSQLGRLVLSQVQGLPYETIEHRSPAQEIHGAMGAAVLAHQKLGSTSAIRLPEDMAITPPLSQTSIERMFATSGLKIQAFPNNPQDYSLALAERLAAFKTLALFQGPEQLTSAKFGARSLLANPLDPNLFSTLNTQGKKASASAGAKIFVRQDFARTSWKLDQDTVLIRPAYPPELSASSLANCAYIEVIIVPSDSPSILHAILESFHRVTSGSFLYMTNFALGSEPTVSVPEDAIRSMVKSQLDTLALDTFLLDKSQIPLSLRKPATGDPMERGGISVTHVLIVPRPERLRPAEGMLPRGINLFL